MAQIFPLPAKLFNSPVAAAPGPGISESSLGEVLWMARRPASGRSFLSGDVVNISDIPLLVLEVRYKLQ